MLCTSGFGDDVTHSRVFRRGGRDGVPVVWLDAPTVQVELAGHAGIYRAFPVPICLLTGSIAPSTDHQFGHSLQRSSVLSRTSLFAEQQQQDCT